MDTAMKFVHQPALTIIVGDRYVSCDPNAYKNFSMLSDLMYVMPTPEQQEWTCKVPEFPTIHLSSKTFTDILILL